MARRQHQRSELHIFSPTEVIESMKVTMTKIAAGPMGVARHGTVLDVKEDEGKELLADQAARPYDPARDAKNKRGWTKASNEVQR